MSRTLRWCFLLVPAALAGCAPSGIEACGDGEPELEIGSAAAGGAAFSAVDEGQVVELVRGPQGGFHIWFQLRARDLCPERVAIQRKATWADGTEISHAAELLTLIGASDTEQAEQGWAELPAARPAILCPTSGTVVGAPIHLLASATDSASRSAVAETVMIPECPAGDQAEACSMLCSPPDG